MPKRARWAKKHGCCDEEDTPSTLGNGLLRYPSYETDDEASGGGRGNHPAQKILRT